MDKKLKVGKINKELKKEIIAMVETDRQMRKSHEWNPEVDRRNTEEMKELIRQYGWPGKSFVGEEASNGVWLLVQHADHDVEFQKEALKLLEETVSKGEAEKKNLAYLTDRVRVNSGERQVFGTQFYIDKKGKFGPRSIENPEHLDERRREFGLEFFSAYGKIMERKYRSFKKKERAKQNRST